MKVIEGLRLDITSSSMPSLISNSYQYYNSKGRISMIPPCDATRGEYEIYCLKGYHFEDIERYATINEALQRITDLLL